MKDQRTEPPGSGDNPQSSRADSASKADDEDTAASSIKGGGQGKPGLQASEQPGAPGVVAGKLVRRRTDHTELFKIK